MCSALMKAFTKKGVHCIGEGLDDLDQVQMCIFEASLGTKKTLTRGEVRRITEGLNDLEQVKMLIKLKM